ncbi:RNA polymerase sigma factor RpoE [Neisseria sp. Ec49-e6-T10]|uniref:RNA polymerase sigma factor RpoE n=1 Tax=Neisseria sp. Ec49-e6-T10 TaxID=3140744 RepID=UPI003EB8EAFA
MTDRNVDQLLVERAQQGEQKAFELLVVKYQRRLARLLSRLIKDENEVEDITQETFIKAYRALPSFRGDSAFYTWLYRIGINTAKNYLVERGRRPFTSSMYAENDEGDSVDMVAQLPDEHTPETELMGKQILETVENAVSLLPEDLKMAIVLRELDGLSYEEIAEVMECPIGTVRSRIFRARDAIAKNLRPLLDTNGDSRW